jgi:3-oxoacyl-[acyl-carrier-protein] synthase III
MSPVPSLEAVATYLPDQRVPVEQVISEFGLPAMQGRLFRRFLGLGEIRIDPGGTLQDLLTGALSGLTALRGQEERVRYVLHARAMPVVVPYPLNPLREVCQAFGLAGAVSFTVTGNACATGLLAVHLAGRLLRDVAEPGTLALVLAGEKAFTADAQLVPGMSVFGEGATACLVSADGDRNRLLSYAAITRGEFAGRLDAMPELAARFEQEYPDLLAAVLGEAVSAAGLTLDDIALILPHNVNVMSWRRFCQRIGFPAGRVLLDNVPVTGHAFCADSFFNYQTAITRGLLQPGDKYLFAAAGLGATFAAMLVEH